MEKFEVQVETSGANHRRKEETTGENAENSVLKDVYDDVGHIIQDVIGSPYLLCFIVVGLWVSCGIVFYQFHDRWTTATAFYYAIEAGLSIGFCYPAEIDDKSRVYTIFYVMIASSFVSGTVGIFLTHLFRQNIHLVPAEHGINAIKIRNRHDEITVESVARYVWYHLKYFIGWYHNRFLTIMTLLFVFWMAVGTVYGVYKEGYTFITGLYWAVTSCATGGLQTPPCLGPGTDDGTTCNMGDFRGTVMGVYFLIGVPIYAITIAQYARRLFGPLAVERELRLMDRPIEDSQFLYAANVLSPEGSETLVMGEYIILELLRLGLVDQARIEQFKQKFYELDVHNKGELEFSDLHAIGKIVPRKMHSVDVARRIRNRSLEFLYRTIPSPTKRNSSGNLNHLDGGNVQVSRESSTGKITVPRSPSASEFFHHLYGSISGTNNTTTASSGKNEPPRRYRPTKRAFRKRIHRSVIEDIDDIPRLIRVQNHDQDPHGSVNGYDDVNTLTGFVLDHSQDHMNIELTNKRNHEFMNTMFDDFDYNIDEENGREEMSNNNDIDNNKDDDEEVVDDNQRLLRQSYPVSQSESLSDDSNAENL